MEAKEKTQPILAEELKKGDTIVYASNSKTRGKTLTVSSKPKLHKLLLIVQGVDNKGVKVVETFGRKIPLEVVREEKWKCDGCGNEFTGKKQPMFDEQHNEIPGQHQCGECFVGSIAEDKGAAIQKEFDKNQKEFAVVQASKDFIPVETRISFKDNQAWEPDRIEEMKLTIAEFYDCAVSEVLFLPDEQDKLDKLYARR